MVKKKTGFGSASLNEHETFRRLPKLIKGGIHLGSFLGLMWLSYFLLQYGIGVYITHNLESTWEAIETSIASDLNIQVDESRAVSPTEQVHEGVRIKSEKTGYEVRASSVSLSRQSAPNSGAMVIQGMSLLKEGLAILTGDLALRWHETEDGIEISTYSYLIDRSRVVSSVHFPGLTPEHMDRVSKSIKSRLAGAKPDLANVKQGLEAFRHLTVSTAKMEYTNLGAFDQLLWELADYLDAQDLYEAQQWIVDSIAERIHKPDMRAPLKRFVFERDSLTVSVNPSAPIVFGSLYRAFTESDDDKSLGEVLTAYGVSFESPSGI